ncbi:MAG: hypothetical protein RJB62_427 [Pseudomonadota bacterium]|jgi:hypothetical protein
MPIESILVMCGVVSAFALFAIAVAYASIVAGGRFNK